jgi:hypothetical protein
MLFLSGYSQTERIKGLRIGIDLSRFSLYYIEPARTCFQVSADFELIDNVYATVEYGQQQVSLVKKDTSEIIIYKYSSSGSYYRIGADFNFLKPKANNPYDMVFLGFRFGSANMNHAAENILVTSGYWGNYSGGAVPKNHINAYWIEFDGGIRAEIFKNFFMGWSACGRIMIHKDKDEFMDPYNIPGYGKGSSKTALGINYSIFYRIPIFKERSKAPVIKVDK